MTIAESLDGAYIAGLDFPVVVADTSRLSREEWLEGRRHGLGGSDAAWVMGMSRYKSTYTGWAEKCGHVPEAELDDVESIVWGNLLEPLVADRFAERFGFEIWNVPVMLAHPEHPWMLANVDRFIVEDGQVTGVLEVKTAGLRMADFWDGDDVPDHYWVQVQHYLAVTGLRYAYLTVLIGGQEQRDYRIERDEIFVQDLIAHETEMWAHIETKVAPPVDGTPSTIDTLRNRWEPEEGSVTDLPDVAIDLIAALAALKARKEEIESEENLARAELMEMLAEHEIGRVDGEIVATWKRSSRSTLDSKRLRQDHPDLAAEYTKTSETRTLLPKYSAVTA